MALEKPYVAKQVVGTDFIQFRAATWLKTNHTDISEPSLKKIIRGFRRVSEWHETVGGFRGFKRKVIWAFGRWGRGWRKLLLDLSPPRGLGLSSTNAGFSWFQRGFKPVLDHVGPQKFQTQKEKCWEFVFGHFGALVLNPNRKGFPLGELILAHLGPCSSLYWAILGASRRPAGPQFEPRRRESLRLGSNRRPKRGLFKKTSKPQGQNDQTQNKIQTGSHKLSNETN